MLNYEQIKKALFYNGFKFIKLEFEANINGEECCDCDEGTNTCESCDGEGYVHICDDNGNETDDTEYCMDCNGEGYVRCNSCGGRWEGGGDDSTLEEFHAKFESNFPRGFEPSYFDTYNDGSVNTEVTITYPVEMLHLTEKLIKAFVKTCDSFDEWNSNGAGFHISLLQSSRYSSNSNDMAKLPEKKINNFLRSMDRIVDAMFLLSTENGKITRSTGYRQSCASLCTKYSAIFTHNNTCIEYRIFDTIYKNPERFLKFMNVIVRTLKFYSTKHYLVEKGWYGNDCQVESGSNQNKVDEIIKNRQWEEFLFKKLTYLYSDKSKLKTIEDCLSKKMISKKTALLQIAK